MAKFEKVERPTKKNEFEIQFSTSHAKKGWRDLRATRLSELVSTWEYLTKTPLQIDPLCYPLRDELEFVSYGGNQHQRWQKKLSQTHGSRIWFFVLEKKVILERVFTNHPNQTK